MIYKPCGCPSCVAKSRALQSSAQPKFHVQLRLMAEQRPVGDAMYSCQLSDGTYVKGLTDADGLTDVITTSRQADVLRVTVAAHPDKARAACCDASERWWENETLHMDGKGSAIATAIVADTPPVITVAMPKGKERPLTRGEEKMARTVFGDGIAYARVKIHHGGWWLFVGNQTPNTAVTPNGKIYVPTPIDPRNKAHLPTK